MMRPPIDQTLWNAAGLNRGDYDSMFALRPDGNGPAGPAGMGFGAPPGYPSNMPMYGAGAAPPSMGLLNMAAAQQQQPPVIHLTPQLIQQIMQQRALMAPQAPAPQPQLGILGDLQQAQGMMGVGGVRR